MRKLLKMISHRYVIVTLLILIQVGWAVLTFLKFASYSHYISMAFRLLSLVVVLWIVKRSDNPAIKLAWIIVILAVPLFGGLLYLFVGQKNPNSYIRKRLEPSIEEGQSYLVRDVSIERELEEKSQVYGQVYYLERQSGFPAYRDSDLDYYRSGEECFEVMLEELTKAKEFIFLEYFILEEGIMWDAILAILEQKVKEGVDVRVMYDDVGCAFVLPVKYKEQLKAKGIKCVVFNRYIPVASTVFNNRDHRKILVIDGRVAFTGGINLADEYINEKQKYGYWKDTGVRIKGKAVYSMLVMFVEMWNAFSEDRIDYDAFDLDRVPPVDAEGFVLPYSDHPMDSEFVGENVYLNMINSARYYIYFFTPYLIIDNEMATALILAAKRGVDVRIITPGIPDKKLVFLVTQSYYRQLIEGGVRIFEYLPGFVHSKCAVCDDEVGTVGTINLDYRSLYLHFENGVFLYKTPSVAEMKADVVETLKDCKEISLEMCQKNVFFELLQGMLRIFAPLL